MKKIKALPIVPAHSQLSQVDSALARRDTQELQQIIQAAEQGLTEIEREGHSIYIENLTVNVNSFNEYSESTTTTNTPTSEADALKGLGFFLLFFGFSVMILGFSVSHQQPIIQQPVEVNHAKS